MRSKLTSLRLVLLLSFLWTWVGLGAPSELQNFPRIVASQPYEGGVVQEDQAFLLTLNDGQMRDSKWILDHLYFKVEGLEENIPAKMITGVDREAILKSQGMDRTSNLIVVQAKRSFPPGVEVTLAFGDEGQKLRFAVRKEFSAQFTCERENPDADCIPITPMVLTFSSKVPYSKARKIFLKSKDGKIIRPKFENSEENEDSLSLMRVRFPGPFPESMAFQLEIPSGLSDDSGRMLSNQTRFPLSVKTGEMPPLAKFSGEFGILEASPDTLLPVTLRNLDSGGMLKGTILHLKDSTQVESWVDWLIKVEEQRQWAKRGQSLFDDEKSILGRETFEFPKPLGSKPMEVVGIPLKKTGFYVVELESRALGRSLLGSEKPMYVSSAALVTSMAVHFKQARESSLAWVTSLENGKPISDAKVEVRDCKGHLLAQGKTNLDGWVKIGDLPSEIEECKREGVYSSYLRGLFVSAQKEGDFSFVHTDWNRGIEPWRFKLRNESNPQGRLTSTVFDRTLVRAGETVHMKHFLRKHSSNGFARISSQDYPSFVELSHIGSDEKFQFPLKWLSDGTAETDWTIPKGAKLGSYSVSLGFQNNDLQTSGRFRVEEFRVPLMKGRIVVPKTLVSPTQVNVDLSAEYLAGGGASYLPVQFRYQQKSFQSHLFSKWEGYTFANGTVQADQFNSEEQASELFTEKTVLGKEGSAHLELKSLKKWDSLSSLDMEMEFRDPNGEVQTVSSSIPVYPSQTLVGVKAESWVENSKSVKFDVAATDLEGNPLPGVLVDVQFIQKKYYSHRKKLIGGYYSYQNHSELKPLGTACSGQTDSKGILSCDVAAPASGNLYLEARAAGSVANSSLYVYDSHPTWFGQSDDERMDILPENKKVQPGDVAVFQVRMPFQEATALVTVEREGILDSFVVPVSSQNPVIKVPIQKNYAPNVFVSVLAVRGRVGEIQPTANVDLGKPSYRLGIAELQVGWKAHELNVKVTSEKPVYQVRDQAKVKIHIDLPGGALPPQGTQAIVAAVDEGLLQLHANESWSLLDAMMNPRGYEANTFTAQMQVIGKRHFGMKGLATGGGGGNMPTRELFDTLLFWNASVPIDKNGNAEVQIPLNDSMTSFRVVAIAYADFDRFGSGYTTFRTTQDLMLLSGIPPLAREGDLFPAVFTLRNTTSDLMQVHVSGGLQGEKRDFQEILNLNGNESKKVSWQVKVPSGVETLTFDVQANAKGSIRDSIKVVEKILPAIPVRTYEGSLIQIGTKENVQVERPAGALPGKGGVQLILEPSLKAGISGVEDYMKAYPYGCLEQRVSKAIALRKESDWDRVMAELPAHLDSEGLVKYFPSEFLQGSDILTSYLLAVSDEAKKVVPPSSLERMTQGLQKFITGELSREKVIHTRDLAIRKMAAVEALSRRGQATVQHLSTFDITPKLWPNSAVIDWLNTLNRMQDIPERAKKLAEAQEILRRRLDTRGTKVGFSSERFDDLSWLMVSSDVTMNRLILTLLDSVAWAGQQEDLPKLVRSSIELQKQGHWSITPANAWGVLALEKFASRYEKSPVQGMTEVRVGSEKKELKWSEHPEGRQFNFSWSKPVESLQFYQKGEGKPWAFVKTLAAIPLKTSLEKGFRIHKSWKPIEQKKPGQWSQGDVVRIRLDFEAMADSTWVVLSDPIPAGATILGTGLGNDSKLLTQSEESQHGVWPIYEERSLDSFRTYYESFPKGKGSVEYTVRLNQSGKMNLPSTRMEAMYFPEMFGELPNEPISITD